MQWAKPGYRRRIACAAVALAASGAVRGAQAADVRTEGLNPIYIRSLRLATDIGQSVQGALPQILSTGDTQTVDCLETLRDAAIQVADALDDVNDLANVALVMRDPEDKKSASSIRDLSAKGALNLLAIDRRQVNETAGECPNQALVQYKARDLIQLIDDASTQLVAMQPGGG